MVRLIDDLLDVARISGGMFELKKEHTDLASVIQGAVETCQPFFDHAGNRIAVRAESTW